MAMKFKVIRSRELNAYHIMTFSKLSLAFVLMVAVSGLNAAVYQGEINEGKLDQAIIL